MALPTVIKTWQRSINQTVAVQASLTVMSETLLLTIKNLMKAFGSGAWTCAGSSNAGGSTISPTGSAAMDGVDRWATAGDVGGTPAGTGGRHTWMVLQQTGIASHYQICWDITSPGSPNAMVFVISPSAGFTGGSATARPTATDEMVTNINAISWFNASNVQHQIQMWQSTDGQCFRLSVEQGGTGEDMFWLLDVPEGPPTGWTNPSASFTKVSSSSFASSYNMANGLGTIVTSDLTMSGESNGTTLLANLAGIGSVPNDFNALWPFFAVGVNGVEIGGGSGLPQRGWLGTLFDLWWKPSGVSPADTFPNNAANMQFTALGVLIHTWTGGSVAPLLT